MPVARVGATVRAAGDSARRWLSKLHPEYRALARATAPDGTPPEAQLHAAMRWMCVAQDATPDDGVARSFALVFNPYFGSRGWQGSYPETTGYIIPTFYDYAALTADDEYALRAGRMAAWECEVQLPNGAVQGGVIGQHPTPAVFNTGQVMFGWLRAHAETGDERYLESARRAGRFLVEAMSPDGGWYKYLSDYAGDGRMKFYTYNVRCAWALAELGRASSDATFSQAAERAGRFARSHQLANGFFESNCLYNPELPHLHTIAYATRGLLETGVCLGLEEFVEGARSAADGVLAGLDEQGFLSDRFDRAWKPVDQHSCLTGVAQIALCWGRLFELGGDERYLEALQRASRYMRRRQFYAPDLPNIHGGISGSHPIEGRYGAYELLNWAAKFFADMLIMELRLAR
jgi:hypothetical protein